MALAPLLHPGSTLIEHDPATRDEALRRIADHTAATLLPGIEAGMLLDLLLAREAKSPTAVPEGVAFPHAIDDRVPSTVLVAARWRTPVDFDGPVPSDLIFTMFGSSAEPWRHVRLLARLARIVRAPGALERLRAAQEAEDLRRVLLQEDDSHD